MIVSGASGIELQNEAEFGNDFLAMTLKPQATKVKIDGTVSILKLLCIKKHSQWNKKATYGIRKNICRSYV